MPPIRLKRRSLSKNTRLKGGFSIMPRWTQTLEERFWGKVERFTLFECWRWNGATMSNGYGLFGIGRKADGSRRTVLAHRWSFEQSVGLIPGGLTIDHLCRNRACVNPAHMEVVTPKENSLRGISPPAQNSRKLWCNNGHPFDGQNTYLNKKGRRECRICKRQLHRNWVAQHRG